MTKEFCLSIRKRVNRQFTVNIFVIIYHKISTLLFSKSKCADEISSILYLLSDKGENHDIRHSGGDQFSIMSEEI